MISSASELDDGEDSDDEGDDDYEFSDALVLLLIFRDLEAQEQDFPYHE